MKYISIDIETTGLDPETCQILSFGAIIEDTSKPLTFEEVPKFYKQIKYDTIVGEPFALNMNKELIKDISENKHGLILEEELSSEFWSFLWDNGLIPLSMKEFSFPTDGGRTAKPILFHRAPIINIRAAGKNFNSFDKLFIERLTYWKKLFKIHQRVLDPAALYVDFYKDEWLPNLDTCLERAGVDRKVSHNALEDAWDTILALRAKYNG